MAQPEYEIRYDPYTGRPIYVPKTAQPQAGQDIISVNGKAGAEAYAMGPNSKALLLDATQPVVWLKSTDGAGYATLDGYDLAPHVEKSPEAVAQGMYENLDARIKKIETLLEVIAGGRQSDTAAAGGTVGE